MEITIKGSGNSFAALGLGNNRWIEGYISRNNITDATTKTALRNLYKGMVNAGIDKKFTYAAIGQGVGMSVNNNLFSGNGLPARYTNNTHVRLHVMNTQNKPLLPYNNGANDYYIGFVKDGNQSYGPQVGSIAWNGTYECQLSDELAGASFPADKTGLATLSQANLQAKVYYNGSIILNRTLTHLPPTNMTFQMVDAWPAKPSLFMGFSQENVEWTDADEQALLNILNQYRLDAGV